MEIKTSRIAILILVVVIPAILIFKNPINLGLDLRGGTSVVLEAQEEDGKKLQPDTMDKVREIVQRRVDGLGVSEPVIQKSGENDKNWDSVYFGFAGTFILGLRRS